MTAQSALALLRQALGFVGLALAAIAVAKFAGVPNIPLRAPISETALVAIACLMAR